MKNYRYWLTAKVVAGLLIALQPAQAATSEGQPDFKQELEKTDLSTSTDLFTTELPLTTSALEINTESPKINPAPLEVAQVLPPNQGQPPVLVPNPEVIIKSNNGAPNPDILSPAVPVAPVLPRAVPAPVGDISISNINMNYDVINLGTRGSTMIPRLVLRQAPVKEVLLVLARYAGMNIIFTDGQTGNSQANQSQQPPAPNAVQPAAQTTISLDLEQETVQQVFNAVLMVSGLKANLRGTTVFVGPDLPPQAMNLVSRTFRLNQAKASNVASYLALQGAQVNVYQEGSTQRTIDNQGNVTVTRINPQIIPLSIQSSQAATPGASTGLTPLSGLLVANDDRINSITLTGEPRQVEIASALITQLDARRRQVAVNVKIVDINLNNIQDYNSSFSFGINDSYFVQDNGSMVMRFGSTSPVTSANLNSASGRITNPPAIPNPLGPNGDSPGVAFYDPNNVQLIPATIGTQSVLLPFLTSTNLGISGNPYTTGITTPPLATIDPTTGLITVTPPEYDVASYFQYPKKFQAQIEAQIRSGNAKILTDPILMVQEGQIASVKLVEQVVSSVNTQVDPLSGVRTTTPVLSDVGLTLKVNIDKIDDNGFISLSVNPLVSSPAGTQVFRSGDGADNQLTLINTRELSSGLVRLRDGQTMILSGIISQIDQTVTSKVPVLGDLPLIGALFRSQTDTTDRSEVIVLLTPQIVHDGAESQFGYNFTPGKATADYLRSKGFPVQAQP
ncbi:secretin N-terminal domain-containing protein [Synechocystis sp. LKSZ1]|uniref:type II secretion system protein GspD n=1 Tax=Synechocystis sp. LKSZ1 TaxID=3144951 RepID=UPI00336BDB7B